VRGKSGQNPVLQINGRSYVDIEALARLVNGSLRINGNQIYVDACEFSLQIRKGFMKAGIETSR